MASAKQLKAQKLFAMRAKRGDFRKAKTKNKKSRSTYCTFCLFGVSDEEAIKKGFIQA